MNRERTLTLLDYEIEQANAALRLAHEYAVDAGCGKVALQISRAIVALRPENDDGGSNDDTMPPADFFACAYCGTRI